MRSRYHPDGSIDYNADRALELLRCADEELIRQHQAKQEEGLRQAPGDRFDDGGESAPPGGKAGPKSLPIHSPTVMDFLQDPIAEMARPLLPMNPMTPNTP